MMFVLAATVTLALERLRQSAELCTPPQVRAFYERRAYAPAWSEEQAAALRNAVTHAGDDALPSAEYELWNRAQTAEERDVLLTDAFMKLAAHLSRGRVNADYDWCSGSPQLDLAAVLDSALRDGTVADVLPALAPKHEEYQRLRRAYAVYRAMSDWPRIALARRTRKRGDEAEDVRALGVRFGMSGESSRFDEELDAAVRDFQRHHGLIEDGVVGPKTLAELNVPREARLRQIAVNLERWRWMPERLGARHLLVNIAAFQLDLIDGGRVTLTSRIVAGKQYRRTPFLAAEVKRVIVNPPWNVPSKIASEELWPKQKRDPSYFAREHMRVVAGGRIRQDPGPWCALGRIKFDMPNRFDVYLHDTPARSLFAADVRAFSHGCMRVERPLELAVELTGRSAAEIEGMIEEGRERTIPLAEPVPVYVLYWTAFVAEDGHAEFRRDVYGRDDPVAERLGLR